MRTLSDTISRLAAMRAGAGDGLPAGSSDRLEPLVGFGSNPGALKACRYRPETLPARAPLVVVLHGCTQTAAAYDHHAGWSRLADEAGVALLYPEQQRQNNANACFNWFEPADVRRSGGEALSIRQMIETMLIEHDLDRDRVFITGLSAGGAMAAAMLACYPDVFAGGAIIAGLPYASASTVPEAFDRMRGHALPRDVDLQAALDRASPHAGPGPRIAIWHGAADRTVAPANAHALAAQWRAVHGLEAATARRDGSVHWERHLWGHGAHEPAIELNIVAGMGHGAPLGDDGVGVPGPFMLAAGVSSTVEIARSWGILRQASVPPSQPVPSSGSRDPRTTGADAMTSLQGTRKVIEDALRSAGLMR
jgi:poly(hydroxyalkanoate) depolymerase family esterase